MPFNLLIDYDNIEVTDQAKGLIYLVETILSKMSPHEINEKNAVVRLYGGWYENNNITRRAQKLNIDINHNFPRLVSMSDFKTQVIVTVELATSLTVRPSIHLFNTYRKNGIPSGLKARHPINNGCSRSGCLVIPVYNFVNEGICSECRSTKIDQIFFRHEQKLVDTMLTSDMISIARQDLKYAIVSSDDDFWPGILTSISLGSIVYHFHTKPGHITPNHYLQTVAQNYYMKSL